MVLIILMCLQSVFSAPLHMQLIPMNIPYPMAQMPQIQNLQQQMLEMQMLRNNPYYMNREQPLVILLSNDELKKNEELSKADYGKEDDDLNSVVINAADDAEQPQRAVFLLPNSRFSIGSLISGIPWLPIEVNVPDSISWAYNGIANGIAGIISIIGQRFQRPTVQESALKSVLNNLQLKKNAAKPVMVMPFDTQVMHLPIQV